MCYTYEQAGKILIHKIKIKKTFKKVNNKSDPNSQQPKGDRLLTKSASKGQPSEHPQHTARVLNYSSVGEGHRLGQSAGLARGRY